LLDILNNTKLMKLIDFSSLDCQVVFKGTSILAAPKNIKTRDKKLPINLYLLQYYITNRKNRCTKVLFNINSTYYFPISLAFSKVYPFLNLSADIYFSLKKYTSLHKIPYSCFSSVISIKGLLIFIFFLTLYTKSNYKYLIYLNK
ncbi:hypothetical protein BKA64DRAFT_587465, partial [Cadophora sp. MPI-SDFR-AT-0126]